MRIIFASNNQHKLLEISSMLSPELKLISLSQAGINEDIPEPFDTLEENALAKARFVYERTGMGCFADDTGLEIDSLDGEPGVLSARYAGHSKDSQANMEKVLRLLANKTNRRAKFRTIIALIINQKEYLFEGVVKGVITYAPEGEGGFGYDPIFIPQGYNQTFAQMPLKEKNLISHRKIATSRLISFLNNYREDYP